MARLAIAVIVVAIFVALIALLLRALMRTVEAEASRPVTLNGGAMPKIAFFLLLCVMAYAIATGSA